MNFLGHLYFSDNDKELMYANLYGDFIRGSQLQQYSAPIRRGVQLHRAIDTYIDNHPRVMELRALLSSDLPKVSGIAIDLYFDHILAKSWDKFHIVEYDQFLSDFYQHSLSNESDFSDNFLSFKSRLIENNWMSHYPTFYGLDRLCEGVGSRLSFPNALPQAPEIFAKHQKEIESAFLDFMNDAIPHFHAFHRND